MTVRKQAVANANRLIEESQGRAIAARQDVLEAPRARTALEAMAARLSVTTQSLQNTLMQTAFKGCSQAEFVALVIVANGYELNPLLREIYAFPKKGGGIQAIVGYDGWIKIAERHPQYDGYEADHIEDEKGNLKAVEGILYRKDRTRPTKKMIYLKEFERNTEPWRNSPNHMLDVRCFCHTVRLALGVSLGTPDDAEMIDVTPQEQQRLPDTRTMGEQIDDGIPDFDRETGEEIPRDQNTGMSEVDEETARALDAGAGEPDAAGEEGEPAEEGEEGEQAEQTDQDDDGVEEATSLIMLARTIREQIGKVMNKRGLAAVEAEWVNRYRNNFEEGVITEIETLFADRKRALKS